MNKEELIERFNMQHLDGEGGFFSIVHPFVTNGVKTAQTIMYLMAGEEFSSLHVLSEDEVWHFYGGTEAKQLLIKPDGTWEIRILNSENPVSVIPKHWWQGTKPVEKDGVSLCGCTMSPPYSEGCFTLGNASLVAKFSSCPYIMEYVR